MASIIIYQGRDNPLDWVLTVTAITGAISYIDANTFDQFVLDLGDIEIDSDDTGFGTDKVFDISVDVIVGVVTVNSLRLRLGLASEVPVGNYKARLIGYNTAYPDGLVWQDKISLKFIA